jgi:hypothetical protein
MSERTRGNQWSSYRKTAAMNSRFEARRARERLDELGALREIEHAVLSHCEEHTRSLHISRSSSRNVSRQMGWRPEVPVPPYDPAFDETLRISC